MSSISFRRWIKWGDDEPSAEKCIVLSSAQSDFVDIRWVDSTTVEGKPVKQLTWAFAGTASYTENHGEWTHWIDSRSDDPAKDEGFIEEINGVSIEKGVIINPDTGKETPYTELWVPCSPVVKAGQSASINLEYETANSDGSIKGRIIRVGSLCHGILKRHGVTTVVLWQLGVADERDSLAEEQLLGQKSQPTESSWRLKLEHGDSSHIPAFLTFGKDEMPETAIHPSAREVSVTELSWQDLVWKRKE